MNLKLLTVAEAAEALAMEQSTLRAWLLRRKINSYRIGRAVRISTEEIERVLRIGLRPAVGSEMKGARYEQ
jgi:excisionase family DNA binding protein